MSTNKYKPPLFSRTDAANFAVYLNYSNRRHESDSGVAVDYHDELLREFPTSQQARNYVHNYRFQTRDTLYICNGDRSLYYMTATTEGDCF